MNNNQTTQKIKSLLSEIKREKSSEMRQQKIVQVLELITSIL